jgi:hypothetical protein
MAFSGDIHSLLKVEPTARDSEWEHAFLHAFAHSNLRILQDTPAAGPDGWPYLLAEISAEGSEPSTKVLSWLSDKGIGLVVNPGQETPDYVFSYGMIWNFRERGEFLTGPSSTMMSQEVEFSSQQKVLAGPPDEKYLPGYARHILRSFFKDNGVGNMNILVMSQDQKNFDLCFSLEALGNPAANEHKGILQALSWFLPPHYSLMLISEKGLPAFTAL